MTFLSAQSEATLERDGKNRESVATATARQEDSRPLDNGRESGDLDTSF